VQTDAKPLVPSNFRDVDDLMTVDSEKKRER
jgi:hypothetical protein